MKTHPAGKLCQFTLDLSLTGSAHAQTYVRGHGYFPADAGGDADGRTSRTTPGGSPQQMSLRGIGRLLRKVRERIGGTKR